MKKLVNQKSKKSNLNTVSFPKNLDKGKQQVMAPLPHEHEKRKMTKNATLPKNINFEKVDLLITPSKDYQSEILSHKKDDSSLLIHPSPIARMSGILTNTQLTEIANTSQIKVVARFRPLNAVEQVTYNFNTYYRNYQQKTLAPFVLNFYLKRPSLFSIT
jgi:hypothetical protein